MIKLCICLCCFGCVFFLFCFNELCVCCVEGWIFSLSKNWCFRFMINVLFFFTPFWSFMYLFVCSCYTFQINICWMLLNFRPFSLASLSFFGELIFRSLISCCWFVFFEIFSSSIFHLYFIFAFFLFFLCIHSFNGAVAFAFVKNCFSFAAFLCFENFCSLFYRIDTMLENVHWCDLLWIWKITNDWENRVKKSVCLVFSVLDLRKSKAFCCFFFFFFF